MKQLTILSLALLCGCSTLKLPTGVTVTYQTNTVDVGVIIPTGSTAPTHRMVKQQVTMTLVPKKGQGVTNIVAIAGRLPPLPPPRPMMAQQPSGASIRAARRVKAMATMPPLPAAPSPLRVFSLVCNSKDGGMLYSTNGDISGLVFTNSTASTTGVFLPTNIVGKAHFPPVPVRPIRKSALTVLPSGPVLSGFWVPWDNDNNVMFVDNMNLRNGSNYVEQTSQTLKSWANLTSFTWTYTNSDAYNRIAVVVPANVTAFKFVRAKTQ